MTDNEIIKALEIHSNDQFDNCEGCPYLHGDECTGYAVHSQPFRDTLDLIKRQQAEIERLKSYNKTCGEIIGEQEIELATAKAEAIKEFAERLKQEAFECDVSFGYGKECYQQAVAVIEIDNLVKEMTE